MLGRVMSSQRILFLANAITLAHPTRMWKIACDMESRGYDVHFATSPTYKKYLLPENPRITCHTITSVLVQDFNDRLFHTKFIFTDEELATELHEDCELVAAIRPDYIIADMRPTAIVPAKLHNIPLYNLTQYHWSSHFDRRNILPPVKSVLTFGRTLSALFEPVISPLILRPMVKTANRFFQTHPVAKTANLPEFTSLSDFYQAGDYALFADLPDLYPDATLESHHHFIGPIIWHNSQTPWPEHWPHTFGEKPVAYVTMGSTGLYSAVPKVLDGLRSLGYQILLSSFGGDCGHLDLRDTWTAPFVPGNEALKRANLIVCNGGTGTTYHALSHGIPIVAVTQNMDQCLHATQLTKQSVGRMIYADQLSQETLTDAITHLQNSPQTRHNLDRMKTAIAGFDQTSTLARLLS